MRKKDKDKDEEGCICGDDCKCGPDCPCRKKVHKEAQAFTFDKFMDSIVLSEGKRAPAGDSPNRERAKRHQERPLGRIRFGGAK